jgi:hypothetical protein
MIFPIDRINQNEEYKNNFYIDNKNLLCTFCKCILNYKNKFLLDQHLKTNKHKNNQQKAEENQIDLYINNTNKKEYEKINIDLICALTQANIPLEKINKLKPFLLKYCKNGM